MKRAAIYARVSTADQDPDVQVRELREFVARRGWQLDEQHVFIDHGVSGVKDRRPALDRMMAAARKRKVDVIVCWSMCRLGRSLRHLLVLVDELSALGADLACYTQPIDTTTPAGRLTFVVLSAVGEFEREMIRSRVMAGVAKAKACGKRLGRPRAELDLILVRARLEAGESLRAVAADLGVHHATLHRALGRGAESPLAGAEA